MHCCSHCSHSIPLWIGCLTGVSEPRKLGSEAGTWKSKFKLNQIQKLKNFFFNQIKGRSVTIGRPDFKKNDFCTMYHRVKKFTVFFLANESTWLTLFCPLHMYIIWSSRYLRLFFPKLPSLWSLNMEKWGTGTIVFFFQEIAPAYRLWQWRSKQKDVPY